jgi:RNA polymerase sigma factor (sigma-70 family)
MSSGASQTGLIRYLRAQAGGALTDGELLARYSNGRDETAFAAVVQRYGGLVLAVARRQLADTQQAEDVFQATFLALARSADRLSQAVPLANWLYTVALRTARKARLRDARRRDYEKAGAALPAPPADPLAEVSGRDLLRAVDEELARMPEKYRLPVLLCCVQGLSREEVARQLGWSAGAVKGRLERGRQRLAARLTERGLAPAALALAAVAVPTDLLASAAALAAAPWSRAVPPAVLALAAVAKPRRWVMALALFGSLLVVGLTGLAPGSGEKGPPPAAPPPRAAQPPAQAPAKPPDDPLPAGSTLRLGTSRYRQGTVIQTLSVSADGSLAATGSAGHIHGRARVFDLTTGRVRATAGREAPGPDEVVALSPDGQLLATAYDGGNQVRDRTTGAMVSTIAPPKPNPYHVTTWILWSPSGKALAAASADGKGVHLLDPERARVTRTFKTVDVVYAAAFSPDGKLLAAGGHDRDGNNYFGRIWEVSTGKELRRFANGHASVRALAFSPDGKTLAGGGDDGRPRLWDVGTGKLRREFKPDGYRVRSVAFAPDGQTVAVAGAGIRLYDPATGRLRLRIDRKALGLHFSPDSKVLTGAVSGAIYRWDAVTGRPLTPQGAGDSAVAQILATPDGRRVVTRGLYGDAHLWDARTGAHLRQFPVAWQRTVALSPDGKHLVWAEADEGVQFTNPGEPNTIYTGSRLRLYDLAAGRFVERFPGFKGSADDLGFAPDGKVLVTIDHRDGGVRLWDVASGKEQRSFRAAPPAEGRRFLHVWRAVLSPDGRTLAVAYHPSGRGIFSPFAVRLWDVASGKETHELPGHHYYVEGLAFSPDSRLLLTGSQPLAEFAQKMLKRPVNQVFVWDVARGRRLAALPDGLPVGATCAAFAPDGRTAATASPDGTIKVWEVATWKVRTEFRGHRDRVTALAFRRDGRLLSGGLDTTVLVWDVRAALRGAAGRP